MDDRGQATTHQALLGRIPANGYRRTDILAEEIDRVFRPSWLCVGFTQDLRNDRDFITAQIGPHGIVVQNFKGVLKAFRNVCSHRFSRIQTEKCGNRPLTCPYHGWSYNAEGVPVGIPHNATAFGLDEADRRALALQAYEVDIVGQFVFVRMTPGGAGLVDYLGSVHDELLHISGLDFERFEQLSVDVACNWKLGMENGVEGYHLPLVHKDSFANVIGTDLSMRIFGPHCTHEGPLTARSKKWWQVSSRAARLERSARCDDYISLMIFPNIVTTFSHGAFFTFQTLWPVTAETMRIESSGWLARGQGAARDMLVQSLKDFSAQVRAEDKAICETAQAGLREAGPARGVLGGMENRVRHFHGGYARRMEVGHA